VEDEITHKSNVLNLMTNDSNIFAKNGSQTNYKRHGKKVIRDVGENDFCTFRWRKNIENITNVDSPLGIFVKAIQEGYLINEILWTDI
jgi:hypothetical protein